MSKKAFARSSGLTFILALLSTSNLYAEKNIDERINEAVAPFTEAISSIIFYAVPIGEVKLPLIIVWLIGGAAVFTWYMNFITFVVQTCY